MHAAGAKLSPKANWRWPIRPAVQHSKTQEETMQTALYAVPLPSGVPAHNSAENNIPTVSDALDHYQIIRRNGSVVAFEPHKIAVAMMRLFWPFTARKVPHRPAYVKPLTPNSPCRADALAAGSTFYHWALQDQVRL